jgi:antitoxin VapB
MYNFLYLHEVTMAEAKLFKVGGSQAVRLPKEFRLPGEKVRIRWQGDEVVITPDRPRKTEAELRAWLAEIQGAFGPDFMSEGRDQPPPQERDWSKFD